MSEVDKILSKVKDLEKKIKKAVAELNKKPGDPKNAQAVQVAMKEIKKLEGEYDAAEKADRKVFDEAVKGLGG